MTTITGTSGNDSIWGTSDDNVVYGLAGNDSINGAEGQDWIYGGPGDDTLSGGAGSDSLYGGDGTDTVSFTFAATPRSISLSLYGPQPSGGNDFDTLFEIENLIGTSAAPGDTLTGDSGANVIMGLGANDTLYGLAGDDTLYGGSDSDFLFGASDNDFLFGEGGHDQLFGGEGADRITGDAGNDTLYGGADHDTLYGGTGTDTFFGGGGNDIIEGGEDPGNSDTDTLDLTGLGPFVISWGGGNNEAGTVTFGNGDRLGFSNIEAVITCFTPGALIDTRRGPVAVEELRIGDRVLTRDNGFQTIRWIGRKTLGAAALTAAPALRPVCIRRDAFGPGVPARDMLVSRQHRMLLTGADVQLHTGETEVLACAAHLSPRSLRPMPVPRELTYIHILFDRHEIVRADGCWTESFQPGRLVADAFEAAVREEILQIFPELALGTEPPFHAARPTLRAWEARAVGR